MFDKYDLFFVYIAVVPFVAAFMIHFASNYIKGCIRRVKSRRAARERLAEMKRKEEYDIATYRFRDPHYYGD